VLTAWNDIMPKIGVPLTIETRYYREKIYPHYLSNSGWIQFSVFDPVGGIAQGTFETTVAPTNDVGPSYNLSGSFFVCRYPDTPPCP
jgi:hypothetical protein